MLVSCRKCNAQFAHSFGVCPACGAESQLTEVDRTASAVEDAKEQLTSGATAQAVRDQLSQTGMGEAEIDDVLQSARALVRSSSRQHGRQIAGAGCLLIVIAFFAFALTGGFVIATGSLAIGIAMVSVGLIKAWTGWNITGKDFE